MAPAFAEIVRAARERTGVPGVAAGLLRNGRVELAADGDAEVDTPFRIASITKSFTATLLAESGLLDARARALLSHTAGFRPESQLPLPEPCAGLWSYSNAGYTAAAAPLGERFEEAMSERVLRPLGLEATGFAEPSGAARGHVQAGATGHRVVPVDVYPRERLSIGGLWSTADDLLRYGLAHCRGYDELHEPQGQALGARYALGWWVRDGVLDHEGSIAGYQSLLLLVPAEELVLAVLTNSWRGSALIRHVVEELAILPPPVGGTTAAAGLYALDGLEATVFDGRVAERERDPVTGSWVQRRYPVSEDALLMSWRSDFPREGVARIGWVALPRA
jgi:CubicO group peptidase (beta-lactamase class C family)